MKPVLQQPWALSIARSAIKMAIEHGHQDEAVTELVTALKNCGENADKFFTTLTALTNPVLVNHVYNLKNKYVETKGECTKPEYYSHLSKDDVSLTIESYNYHILNCIALIKTLTMSDKKVITVVGLERPMPNMINLININEEMWNLERNIQRLEKKALQLEAQRMETVKAIVWQDDVDMLDDSKEILPQASVVRYNGLHYHVIKVVGQDDFIQKDYIISRIPNLSTVIDLQKIGQAEIGELVIEKAETLNQ
jgi:hypothetical protein